MVGTKRSTRLAARNSKPKYNELETEEDEDNSSKKLESDDDGESDFSGVAGSDDASDLLHNKARLPPAETKAVTRRGKLGRQPKRLSETSKPYAKNYSKAKSKRQSKVKCLSPSFDQKDKTEISLSTDDDGSDHAAEDGCDQRKITSLKSGKRSQSTSDVSRDSINPKPSTRDNGKIPPPDDEMSGPGDAKRNAIRNTTKNTTRNATRSANDDLLLQPLNNVGSATNADSGKKNEDDPPTSTKVNLYKGGRRREANGGARKRAAGIYANDSKAYGTRRDSELKTTTDGTEGNTLLPVNGNYYNPQRKIESPPSLTSTSDGLERRVGAKYLTESDTTECKEDMPNESIMLHMHYTKWKREVDIAGNEQVDATENVNQGGNYQTSADSSMQIDSQGKENDIDKFKRTIRTLALIKSPFVPSSPPNNKKKTLSSGGEASASTEVNRAGVDGISDSPIIEPNGAIDTKAVDQNKSGEFEYSPGRIEHDDAGKNDNGSAILDLANSRNNASNALGVKVDATVGSSQVTITIASDETTLHHPSTHTSMGMECILSSEMQIGHLIGSNQQNSLAQQSLIRQSTDSMSIQYLKPKRSRRAPSLGQLKMALYLEASNAHRGNGAERKFANYWETLEKYVTLGSHGAIQQIRSDLSASSPGIEVTMTGFLKTRKMKRLHNKLVLAIMMEAMRTNIPARCSLHVPLHWQTTTTKSVPDQLNEEVVSVDVDCHDRKSDQLQWNADFGPRSGAWTVCGDELAPTKTTAGHWIRPELTGSIPKRGLEEEEVLPSARLPGALDIEPLMRKHTTDLGLTASENAIWMLVVAVREHSLSIIRKIIANDHEFEDGYAPSLPTHFQTSLACHHLTSENDYSVHRAKKSGGGKKRPRKVINSISLSHVLAETPSVASRLISMRSAAMSDDRGISSYPGLDNVNCIINASIQRGATKRQRSSDGYQNVSTAPVLHLTPAFPARMHAGPKTQSDGNFAKAQISATQSLSTASLPLKKSKLVAQRTDQSIPPPLPPQYHMALPSMPSQNMQSIHSAQLMSHSDHTKESKLFKQHTLPISRADISNSEPLTKPGFPSFMNVSQKPEQSRNPAPSTKTSSLPKTARRGSKNLAAMMARPSSQPKLASDKGSTTGDGKNANGASLVKSTATKQKDGTKEQTVGAKDNKDDTDGSTQPSAEPSRPRGRGFGVKNLARMRARTS